jgi:hypothetical protein
VSSDAAEPVDWLLTANDLASLATPAPEATASEPLLVPSCSASVSAEPPRGAPGSLRFSTEDLDLLVRAVAERLTEQVVREIAWEIVPDLAESIIRERIRQLEQADPDKA